ncbi:MAG TPA: hypothetical protein VIN08_07735 [Ohtaekwangia sp.]
MRLNNHRHKMWPGILLPFKKIFRQALLMLIIFLVRLATLDTYKKDE